MVTSLLHIDPASSGVTFVQLQRQILTQVADAILTPW